MLGFIWFLGQALPLLTNFYLPIPDILYLRKGSSFPFSAIPDEACHIPVGSVHFVTELPPLISFLKASSTNSDRSISRLIASIFAFFHNSGSTFIDVTSLFLCEVECFAFMQYRLQNKCYKYIYPNHYKILYK